jgi:hypothetical protein
MSHDIIALSLTVSSTCRFMDDFGKAAENQRRITAEISSSRTLYDEW